LPKTDKKMNIAQYGLLLMPVDRRNEIKQMLMSKPSFIRNIMTHISQQSEGTLKHTFLLGK